MEYIGIYGVYGVVYGVYRVYGIYGVYGLAESCHNEVPGGPRRGPRGIAGGPQRAPRRGLRTDGGPMGFGERPGGVPECSPGGVSGEKH